MTILHEHNKPHKLVAQQSTAGKQRVSRARIVVISAALVVVCLVAFGCLGDLGVGKADREGAQVSNGEAAGEIVGAASDADETSNELSEEQIAALEAAGAIEPNTALVLLADGATAQNLQEFLVTDERLGDVTVQDVGSTYATLSLPEDVSLAETLAQLQDSELVEIAQPNYIYTVSDDDASADASAPSNSAPHAEAAASSDLSAALVPDGIFETQAARSQWALDAVHASDAWTYVAQNMSTTARANPVTVAVIDEGFMVNHEDIDQNAIAATYDAAGDYRNAPPDTDVSGVNDHGTHVMGIIAATTNNPQGISGVRANNLGIDGVVNNWCKVLPIKVAIDVGGEIYTRDLLKAFEYLLGGAASTYNVKVINMSLGGKGVPGANLDDRLLQQEITRARLRGITTVVAAGNSDSNTTVPYSTIPGDYANVVTVMNVYEDKTLTEGVRLHRTSNYNIPGQQVKNICAPGTSIISLADHYTYDNSTNSYGNYVTKTGTSMASPCVAGIVGLMYTVTPRITPTLVEDALYTTAKDLTQTPGARTGWDERTGYGLVDAAAAVKRAGELALAPAPEPTPEPEPTPTSPTQPTTPAQPTTPTTPTTPAVQTMPMYRLYNKWSSEHFYTTNRTEYQSLIRLGWTDEKIAWYAPRTGTPVYRLYNRWTGDHHYTTNRAEYTTCVRQGWNGEGIAFHAGGSTPVYRLYNPYTQAFYHHYTTSATERAACLRAGWRSEGVGWYAS